MRNFVKESFLISKEKKKNRVERGLKILQSLKSGFHKARKSPITGNLFLQVLLTNENKKSRKGQEQNQGNQKHFSKCLKFLERTQITLFHFNMSEIFLA